MSMHYFKPTAYYNSFGSHPHALTIADGDTVVTTIIDAWGADAQGNQVAGKPNPQTGPFYVKGAEPGDTLEVRIDRLTPNRESGFTKSILAPNVVDPEAVPTLPEVSNVDWRIDRAKSTATLLTAMAGLSGFTLPLSPMLGCLGVAPVGGQAIASSTSGPYGGNMDYRGVKAGATLYFPVFAPGALLHLGDGHAVQGDGEIVGTGIETTFDVQFTVRLHKGRQINWPRGENNDYIFTLGNARPLDQALQHATTEMLLWLVGDYGLSAPAASTLLGMCVEYEVGNIYDPAYTMVCKLPKRLLGARTG